MTEVEIEMAQDYLRCAGQDPVAALIRSVRDLARMRRLHAGWVGATERRRREETVWPDLLAPRDLVEA